MVKGITLYGFKRHLNCSDCFYKTYRVTHDGSGKQNVGILWRAAHDLLWMRQHRTFIQDLPQAATSGSCSDLRTHNIMGWHCRKWNEKPEASWCGGGRGNTTKRTGGPRWRPASTRRESTTRGQHAQDKGHIKVGRRTGTGEVNEQDIRSVATTRYIAE